MIERTTMRRLVRSAIRPASIFGAIPCLLVATAVFAAPYQVNESFDVDPEWDAFQNQTGFNNFGFSNTNNAGGPSGEMGGISSRDPRGWYADDIGSLDPSTDALSMSGTMVINYDGNNDGESYLGWFDADDLGNESYPEYWMGFRLQNDPPFQVRLLWVTGDDGPLGQEVAANQGTDWTNGVPFPFQFTYDPDANSGNGQITAQVGTAAPVVSNLGPGAKDLFPNFDHWGLISSNFAGSSKTVEVFVDSVSYTANVVPEPASVTLFATALLGLGALRRRMK